jgi:cytochrome c peroxidase
LELFVGGETGCFHCHSKETLTNDGYFNNGTFVEGGDAGRQLLTGRTGDLGKFRVPSLRNVAVTAPYMHDGSLATLREVVEHYAAGGNGHPSTDVQIEPLNPSADDKADLVAFLQALTDEDLLSAPRFQRCDPH